MGDQQRPGLPKQQPATGRDRARPETARVRDRAPARVTDTLEPPPQPGGGDGEDGSGADG